MSAIRSQMSRSVLTMLGIVIGIMLVTIVMSVGAAVEAFIIGQVESFGSDVISVEVRAPGLGNAGVGIVVTTMKIADATAIAKLPDVDETYAGYLSQAAVSVDGRIKKANLFGVSEAYVRIDDAPIAQGRFFSEDEDRSLSRVVVLGSEIAETFFPSGNAVSNSIKIDGSNYRIIGVFEPRGAAGFFDRDNIVVMPVQTLQSQIAGVDYVSFIVANLNDADKALRAKADIEELMRVRHKISSPDRDDFAVFTIQEARELTGTILFGLQILLLALASISLVVGGVGIMNIMYVSVSERTFEIGLRKAIGARYKDVLLQFLIEASVLTLLGGIIGIALGIGVSYLASVFAQKAGFDWQFIVGFGSIFVALGFSMAVGIIFGLAPAKKAAKLEPITALRYE
ncbi:MAG: ABC transporter permease [Candidatus Paceibacterota bacterium]